MLLGKYKIPKSEIKIIIQILAYRFDLILLASKRARQLASTSREPLVETKDDKNTLIALKEIEEGLIDKETLDRTLEEDVLLDQFSSTKPSEPDVLG